MTGPARGVVDHVGEQLVGPRLAQLSGAATHLEDPLRVGCEAEQVRVDPVGREVGVVDEQSPAGRDDVGGVEPLLAVADRQRHVDGGKTHGGQLAHRVGARAGDDEVGGGIRELHAVGVGHDDVAHSGGRRVGLELLAEAR